ncbi:MAG: class I SAM-dependent methyltransferase [Rhodomicrobium sp.]
MSAIYIDKTYLEANPTWHEEDSPWKADQIARMLNSNNVKPATVAEIGCGAGGILAALRSKLPQGTNFKGYDIAPAALEKAKAKEQENLTFYNQDLLLACDTFDLLLIIDVIEHIPNYYSFAQSCRQKAKYKIYHIPLEINVQSVLRASFAFTLDSGRNEVGHLHFFTAESALMALKETGHKIIDVAYTNGGIALARFHPSLKRSIANVPRRMLSAVSTAWAARLLGGYSLLVLCE